MIRWPKPYLPPINLWNVPRLENEMSDKYEHTNIDNIETLLLMAMMARSEYQASNEEDSPKNKSKNYSARYKGFGDVGSFAQIENRSPDKPYTFDVDGTRIYTDEKELLLKHPFEIIGQKAESIMIANGRMTWVMFEEIKKPKRICSVGRADKWFAFHHRSYSIAGMESYDRVVVPAHKTGRILPYQVEGLRQKCGSSPESIQGQMNLTCSIIEDAHRPGTLLAECSCDSSLIFPVAYGAHKDFLALREGPKQTPTGRRNPILHFVRKHLRSPGTEIAKHWRGVDQVEISGMKLKLSSHEAEL